ncbi:fibronectin type III domain-containing protein [bacterium]|nr:fibronectin type III domain-containing protein [bacterium]
MTSAYKPLLLLAVAICFCSACAQAEQVRAMGASPGAGTEEVSPSQLQAPTGLTLRIVPEGFLLSWSSSPQEPVIVTGYEVVRATYFSGPYESVGTVDRGVFSFVDKTAKPEAIYFYKVRAMAGSQYSLFSREASGERPGTP